MSGSGTKVGALSAIAGGRGQGRRHWSGSPGTASAAAVSAAVDGPGCAAGRPRRRRARPPRRPEGQLLAGSGGPRPARTGSTGSSRGRRSPPGAAPGRTPRRRSRPRAPRPGCRAPLRRPRRRWRGSGPGPCPAGHLDVDGAGDPALEREQVGQRDVEQVVAGHAHPAPPRRRAGPARGRAGGLVAGVDLAPWRCTGPGVQWCSSASTVLHRQVRPLDQADLDPRPARVRARARPAGRSPAPGRPARRAGRPAARSRSPGRRSRAFASTAARTG